MNKWLLFRISDVLSVIIFIVFLIPAFLEVFDFLFRLLDIEEPSGMNGFGLLLDLSFAATLFVGIILAIFHRFLFIFLRKRYLKKKIPLNALFNIKRCRLGVVLRIIFILLLIIAFYGIYQALAGNFAPYQQSVFYFLAICLIYISFNFIVIIYNQKSA